MVRRGGFGAELDRVAAVRSRVDEVRQVMVQNVEAVLARDPDVILGGSNAELTAWQAWPSRRSSRADPPSRAASPERYSSTETGSSVVSSAMEAS